MLRFSIAATAALVIGLSAGAAEATVYSISVTGTITSVSGSPGPLSSGSTVTLTTTFDDSWTAAWGATGNSVAASMATFGGGPNTFLPTSGPLNWSITAGGVTWGARDYAFDFSQPFYHDGAGPTSRTFFGPFIVFNGSGVLGVGNLQQVPVTNLPRPIITGPGGLLTQSGPGNFAPLSYGTTFTISPNIQGGDIGGQIANGVWDVAHATVTPVPEIATWVSLIVGFGAVGAVMRRRRITVAA